MSYIYSNVLKQLTELFNLRVCRQFETKCLRNEGYKPILVYRKQLTRSK